MASVIPYNYINAFHTKLQRILQVHVMHPGFEMI